MGKDSFLKNRRMLFLTVLFMCISHVVSAPTIDFRLRSLKFRSASGWVDRKYHESEFSRFINDLGRRESGNNWLSVNCIGCFGEWQFAESTVHFLGYKNITLRKFKADSNIFPRELQRKVLESLIKVNLSLLRDYEHFIGDTINDIVITKSGIIAASHLGGARSVKLFLTSHGRINKKDVLGTSVYGYLKRFRYYDLG